jgi:hypothetical protein
MYKGLAQFVGMEIVGKAQTLAEHYHQREMRRLEASATRKKNRRLGSS